MGYMEDGLPKWHFDRERRKKLFADLKDDLQINGPAPKKKPYTDAENAKARKEILERFNQRNSYNVFMVIVILLGITATTILLFFFYINF